MGGRRSVIDVEAEQCLDDEQSSAAGKRVRKGPERLDTDAYASNKKPKAPPPPAAKGTPAPRKPYNRSGLFSSDPVKAALAREALTAAGSAIPSRAKVPVGFDIKTQSVDPGAWHNSNNSALVMP